MVVPAASESISPEKGGSGGDVLQFAVPATVVKVRCGPSGGAVVVVVVLVVVVVVVVVGTVRSRVERGAELIDQRLDRPELGRGAALLE